MNSQFILNYTGSKFKETKELDCINFDIYDTIIEPFGGSYGFSRYLYKMRNYKRSVSKSINECLNHARAKKDQKSINRLFAIGHELSANDRFLPTREWIAKHS